MTDDPQITLGTALLIAVLCARALATSAAAPIVPPWTLADESLDCIAPLAREASPEAARSYLDELSNELVVSAGGDGSALPRHDLGEVDTCAGM